LRIKEQGTHLTLHEHDDDDESHTFRFDMTRTMTDFPPNSLLVGQI